MADLAVWQRTIVDEEGNVIPGAEIEVRREEDDSLATLYADRAGETPLANPMAADMSGFVRFFAQGDAYTITAVGAGSTRTWRFDPTGRLQEFDRVSEALNADGGADIVSARANLGTFSTVAEVQSRHIPAVLDSIRVFGRDGDPPLDMTRAGAEEPEFGPKLRDASGVWFFKRTSPLNAHDFGIRGSDNEAAAPDETTSFREALRAAAALRMPLKIPGTNYRIGAISHTDAFRLYLEGDPTNRPIIRADQAVADAGGTLWHFGRSSYEIDNTIALVEDVHPHRKKVKLSDVSGLSPGMMIQWTSDQLWYYDHRNQNYKGELHKIVRVLEATDEIEVDDHTRDFYDISEEVLTVRAWWPDEAEISSVEFYLPPPATNISTRALTLDRTVNLLLADIMVQGSTFYGISNQRSWRARFDNIEAERIGRSTSGSIGYGLQERSTYGTRVRGLKGRALRRAIDFHSRSGDSGAPSRDWLVEDFEITGGGTEYDGSEYWPEGSVPSFGVGMHGPSENGVLRDGIVSHVQEGVTVRGRNTEVRDVRFIGRLERCIAAGHGTGLIVDGCAYEREDFPDKVSAAEAAVADTADTFVRLGVSPSDGLWGYDSPTAITNNVAHGLKDSFVLFASSNHVRNLVMRNNNCIVRPQSGESFYMLKTGAFSTLHIHNSVVDRGSNTIYNYGPGDARLMEGVSTVQLGSVSTGGLDAAVQMGPLSWALRIPDDGVARIRGVSPQGDRVAITLTSTGNNLWGGFVVRPLVATLTAVGGIGPEVVGTADPEALTGTTGNDGDFSIGLTADGDLWMENRTGFLRRLDVAIHA